jgi:hypothetical protein
VRALLVVALTVACAGRAAPRPTPSPRAVTTWRIGVVTGSAGRTTTEVYTLDAVPRPGGAWAFATRATEGTIEEGAAAIQWSSEDPRPEDPWPLVVQYAISSVPAPIVFDPSGRPERLVDPSAWRDAARAAVAARDLPEQAGSSVEPLLDADGLIRDLQRTFPGQPPADGAWVRDETIAGLTVRRIETCTASEAGGAVTWTCAGTLEPLGDRAGRLFDAETTTTLTLDRHGLVTLDSRYVATLVRLDATGERAFDVPVAGRRQVVRQPR